MNKKAGRDWKHVINVIFRYIMLVIIALMIGLGAYSLNSTFILHESMPMPLGYGMAVVMSGSMEPELSVDDLVIVKQRDSYKVGDIVAYQGNSNLVTHRIVEINGEEIITQGDANNAPDAPIDVTRIKGKIVTTVPGIGRLLLDLKSPKGMILIIAVAVIVIELSRISERRRGDKELEEIAAEIRRLKGDRDEREK